MNYKNEKHLYLKSKLSALISIKELIIAKKMNVCGKKKINPKKTKLVSYLKSCLAQGHYHLSTSKFEMHSKVKMQRNRWRLCRKSFVLLSHFSLA